MKSAEKALNAAVKYASNNKFTTWKALLDSFISDVRKHGSKEEGTFEQVSKEDGSTVLIPQAETHAFLTKYCGIDLNGLLILLRWHRFPTRTRCRKRCIIWIRIQLMKSTMPAVICCSAISPNRWRTVSFETLEL